MQPKRLNYYVLFFFLAHKSIKFVPGMLWMQLWTRPYLAVASSQNQAFFCKQEPGHHRKGSSAELHHPRKRKREKEPKSKPAQMEIPLNLPGLETDPIYVSQHVRLHRNAVWPPKVSFPCHHCLRPRKGEHLTSQINEWFIYLSLFMARKHYNALNK